MSVISEPQVDIVGQKSQFEEQLKQALKKEASPSQSREEAAEIAATEKAKQEKQRTRRMKQDIKLRKRYSKKIDFFSGDLGDIYCLDFGFCWVENDFFTFYAA